jgi:hypothetical protein
VTIIGWFKMNLEEYSSLVKVLIDKIPAGSWLIPLLLVLFIFKLLKVKLPKFQWEFKFQAGNWNVETKNGQNNKVARNR